MIDTKVDFETDEAGNWTGQWTTEGDLIQKHLLDEDLGFKIELENMEILGSGRRMLHADDASFKSFRVPKEDDGQSTQLPDDATDAVSVATSAVSEASGDRGQRG